MGTNNQACLVRLQKTHALMATITLLTSIIEVSLLHTSGPTILMNGRVRLHEPLFRIQKGKKASSIKQNEIANLFNEMKLRICFQNTKVSTLVHRLQVNVYPTHSTNYFLGGRTMSFSLFARFRAIGVTAFSISSCSEAS